MKCLLGGCLLLGLSSFYAISYFSTFPIRRTIAQGSEGIFFLFYFYLYFNVFLSLSLALLAIMSACLLPSPFLALALLFSLYYLVTLSNKVCMLSDFLTEFVVCISTTTVSFPLFVSTTVN